MHRILARSDPRVCAGRSGRMTTVWCVATAHVRISTSVASVRPCHSSRCPPSKPGPGDLSVASSWRPSNTRPPSAARRDGLGNAAANLGSGSRRRGHGPDGRQARPGISGCPGSACRQNAGQRVRRSEIRMPLASSGPVRLSRGGVARARRALTIHRSPSMASAAGW
jgi:hypothetical protein